jgi:lipoic acid synthetase
VRLGLKHVVLTSVTRDDLPDGGAGQFARSIQAIRMRLPNVTIEVLVPDFQGSTGALEKVFAARPDVFNHNIETVERLTSQVRDGAGYSRSLDVLAQAKQSGFVTKSGIMVGLGETCGEVLQTMSDLRNSGCDMLTIGQYLRPTKGQMKVAEYVHPIVFDWFAELGKTLGFVSVKAGPLIRSSYHARAN